MAGNTLSSWNYGASFGNLYFSSPLRSSLFGAGYSALQGKSFSYISSNFVVNYGSGRFSTFIQGAPLLVNPYTQHAFGIGIVPFYSNMGNTLLNPIKE